MGRLTFLGTGNYLATDRYWNGFVIDDHVLVEPSPTALPHLHRSGFDLAALDVVVISHFHADHTFGWPFLLLALVADHRERPLSVVGPPGVESQLRSMMELGGVASVQRQADELLDIRYLEVDGSWQQAGPLRFRAVEVEHVPYLRCFGYAFDVDGRTIGYSGDTRPCAGLDELAGTCDVLVLECNGAHPPPKTHMDVADVRSLRQRFPDVTLLLTHVGDGVDATGIDDCTVPDDFQVVDL